MWAEPTLSAQQKWPGSARLKGGVAALPALETPLSPAKGPPKIGELLRQPETPKCARGPEVQATSRAAWDATPRDSSPSPLLPAEGAQRPVKRPSVHEDGSLLPPAQASLAFPSQWSATTHGASRFPGLAPSSPQSQWLSQRLDRGGADRPQSRAQSDRDARGERLDNERMRMVAVAFDEAVQEEVIRWRTEQQSTAEVELVRLTDEYVKMQETRQSDIDLCREAQAKLVEVQRDLVDKLCAEQKAKRAVDEQLAQVRREKRGLEGQLSECMEKLCSTMDLLREQRHRTSEEQEKTREQEKRAKEQEKMVQDLEQRLREQKNRTREQEQRTREEVRARTEAEQKLIEQRAAADLAAQEAAKAMEQRYQKELQQERGHRRESEEMCHKVTVELQQTQQQFTSHRRQSRGALEQIEKKQEQLAQQSQSAEADIRKDYEAQRVALLEKMKALDEKLKQTEILFQKAQKETEKALEQKQAAHKETEHAQEETGQVREEFQKYKSESDALMSEIRGELAEKCEELRIKEEIIQDIEDARSQAQIDAIRLSSWLDEELVRVRDNISQNRHDEANDIIADFDKVIRSTKAIQDKAKEAMSDATKRPAASHPAKWCISAGQLKTFAEKIQDDLVSYCKQHRLQDKGGQVCHICSEEPCPHDHKDAPYQSKSQLGAGAFKKLRAVAPTTQLVEQRYIRPELTDGMSFALLENPGGRSVDVFVSHTWNGPFLELVEAATLIFKKNDSLWISAFAMPLNQDAGDDLMLSPAVQALEAASRHLAVWDTNLELLGRAWCVYELALSLDRHKPIYQWISAATDFSEIKNIIKRNEPKSAKASREEDLAMIKSSIKKSLGGASAVASKLKSGLTDRLTGYEEVLANHKDDIARLQRKLKDARENKDDEQMADAEGQLKTWSKDIARSALTDMIAQDRQLEDEAFTRQISAAGKEAALTDDNDKHDKLLAALQQLNPGLAEVVQQVFTQKDQKLGLTREALVKVESHCDELKSQKLQSYENMESELADLRTMYKLASDKTTELEQLVKMKDDQLEQEKLKKARKAIKIWGAKGEAKAEAEAEAAAGGAAASAEAAAAASGAEGG